MIFGTHDDKTLHQLADVETRAERVALMADGHLGYVMPIGGVAAYDEKVSPVGVGFDIACGNCAIQSNLRGEDLEGRWNEVADEIAGTVSFGVGRNNLAGDAPTDAPLFDDPWWGVVPRTHVDRLRDKSRSQLGTVGGGNHYVDVFTDETDRVWVGVHFGSRGLGHTIASTYLALSQDGQWGDRGKEREVLLPLDTPLGDEYWRGMELAGDYAYAGREWVARKTVAILGGSEVEMVHNHHNFAWREEHGGREYIVIRKGATPAFPGQLGFVGGSMGDVSVILEGTGEGPAEAALYSTVHGAGRVMGRMAAKGKWKKGRQIKRGAVSREMMDEATKGVVLRGGDLDEAPQVYRKLDDVLSAQGDTVRVLHRLRPRVVCMAPPRTFDPYKD